MFNIRINPNYKILLIYMMIWIIFIFVENVFFYNHYNKENLHFSAPKYSTNQTTSKNTSIPQNTFQTSKLNNKNIPQIKKDTINKDILEQNSKIFGNNNIKINDIKQQTTTLEQINILKKIYKKENNNLILEILIPKLVENFEFDEAWEYAEILVSQNGINSLNPKLYLYILINSDNISVTNNNSIKDFKNVVEQYRLKGLITQDDYRFYNGLLHLWNYDYNNAWLLFKQITSPAYLEIIQKIQNILEEAQFQKDMPGYYQDALIGLVMLNNGYFNISKKISIDILSQNDDYILPYQILAYTNFLTNKYEASIEYIFKLIELDKDNKYFYKFLLGISYYWIGKYEESTIYLNQVESEYIKINKTDNYEKIDKFISDVRRYKLLNYLKLNEIDRALRVWQNIIGVQDINKSDFYTYFYNSFYKNIGSTNGFEIYKNNTKLAEEYIYKCYKTLPDKQVDICLYGEVGLDIIKKQYDNIESKLLYISEKYPQAYIYNSLGDFYNYYQNNTKLAKQHYLKAISLSNDPIQENNIKTKILEFVN